MSQRVISVDDVWKQYRLGVAGAGQLGADLKSLFSRRSAISEIIEENDRSVKGKGDKVWALQNISFELNQGEVLGVVGKNGAGKSTLLKLLSRVTSPTKGEIKIKGRIASLLEVGTGFHPELSGRENVFLNGAILGMTKAEIRTKFDEIVAFSGVERYIDTPVKRYSSGMYVRLAFAVAAHLEPEILIVDEVLAVGDSEFQKKCLSKMKQVSNDYGRTILFVSHNLVALRSLCTRAILLENGRLTGSGNVPAIIGQYMGRGETELDTAMHRNIKQLQLEGVVSVESVCAVQEGAEDCIRIEHSFTIEIKTEVYTDKRIDFTFQFVNEEGDIVFVSGSGMQDNFNTGKGKKMIRCNFPADFFNSGRMALNMLVVEDRSNTILKEDYILNLVFVDGPRTGGQWMGKPPGFLKPKFKWEVGE